MEDVGFEPTWKNSCLQSRRPPQAVPSPNFSNDFLIMIIYITILHWRSRCQNSLKLVEGVGVEPTYPVLQTGASTVTANLPLKIFFFMSRRNIRNYLHIVNRFIRYLLKYLINFLTLCKNWWARKDLNFQTPKRTLLQSAPLPVTGYLPIINSWWSWTITVVLSQERILPNICKSL